MQDIQVIDNGVEFTVTVDDATFQELVKNQGIVDGTVTIEGSVEDFLDRVLQEENKVNIEVKEDRVEE
jgi:hypothetical protein|nr:MAG TPA: hypothetical protein [Caudoviricetes sp.]